MNTVYGVLGSDNGVIDVSKTERGAKIYATRNNYDRVYSRANGGYSVTLIAVKYKGKWYAPEALPEINNETITDIIDPTDLSLHDNTGGYGSCTVFVTKDGGVLSLATVQEELKADRELFSDEYDPQWFIVASFVNWEDHNITDSHTGKLCPAVYEND